MRPAPRRRGANDQCPSPNDQQMTNAQNRMTNGLGRRTPSSRGRLADRGISGWNDVSPLPKIPGSATLLRYDAQRPPSLVIGHWSLIGHWCLGIGHSPRCFPLALLLTLSLALSARAAPDSSALINEALDQ